MTDDKAAYEESLEQNIWKNPEQTEVLNLDYPTEWHFIDTENDIQCRQITPFTYQLRSVSHFLTLTKEGFDLYRDNSPQGQAIYEDWCDRNHIVSTLRTDIDG